MQICCSREPCACSIRLYSRRVQVCGRHLPHGVRRYHKAELVSAGRPGDSGQRRHGAAAHAQDTLTAPPVSGPSAANRDGHVAAISAALSWRWQASAPKLCSRPAAVSCVAIQVDVASLTCTSILSRSICWQHRHACKATMQIYPVHVHSHCMLRTQCLRRWHILIDHAPSSCTLCRRTGGDHVRLFVKRNHYELRVRTLIASISFCAYTGRG
jgi:hypothetical protein